MIAYILVLTIQCAGNYTATQTSPYDKPEAVMQLVDHFTKDNKINVAGHKQCWVSDMEWYEGTAEPRINERPDEE